MNVETMTKALVSAFILLIGAIQLFWCLPEGYLMRKILHKLVYKQVVWCGLDHYWALFAPEPVSLFFQVTFRITYHDGTSIPFILPELTIKSSLQFKRKTRYLKWCYSLTSREDEPGQRAICEYISKCIKESGGPQPSHIKILLNYKPKVFARMKDMPWVVDEIYSYDNGLNN